MSKNTIRGLHFQNGEFAQSKLVKVVRGKVLDFIVDLRPESLYHMNVKFYELDDSVELYVPKGFAHGFITLTDNTIVQYLVDNDYSPENEGCLNWEELPIIKEEIEFVFPDFNPDEVVISDKDKITYNLPEPVESTNEPATEKIIVDLIIKYPNDLELGRMVRRLYNPY
jgi:dTDP-4-dehydrorhamnose 3,5-epimerase